ncbi:hypothetical protein [Pseudonocardia humida]|uniref:Oxidoreductase n=1 Tax=Pseudonocardia humida TaxID=2800819 RepID=A0ABT1A1W7_9PSEU|nr:hypothetical protein [Pseudonocardia humida]MCO1656879.1 hypothetical protein [Pseudonocardia humida]
MVGDPEADLRDALATGRELDMAGGTVPAGVLAAVLTAEPPPGAPALRLRRARLSGVLRLTGARVGVPVELRECAFAHAPDLRMAEFAGLALTGCRLPGLRAGNLRVAADLLLADGFTATGPVTLSDAQIGGSLRLSAGRLRGSDGRALLADRIVVGGTFYARRLRSDGELRLPGARITGNVDLAGADLVSPTGDALDMTGVSIDGSFLAGRHGGGPDLEFRATGRILLTGARVGGDVVLSGARVERVPTPGPPDPEPVPDETRMPVVPGGIVDAGACLVADRVRVEGNLELDDGLSTDGTVRLPNAVVGGYLRLSGARLLGPHGAGARGIALLGDGIDVGGDLEARDSGRGALVCGGQLRLVDATVRGSASLSGITLSAPGGYALLADRLHIGGEFYLRRMVCDGTVRLQNAEIGATLDCTGARLTGPRRRPDGSLRPSLDARAATIGKDLVCAGGFSADGGVRIRRADVGKAVQFTDATLGGPPEVGRAVYSLNAYALTAAELIVRPAAPPVGPVRLARASVTTFADSAALWAADGGVDIDGFDYGALYDTRAVDVRTRLAWIREVMPDYTPGPYDQLAAAYQRSGNEELAQAVLMERQRRRYAEAAPVERVWGWLQRWTVGFGYRPWLAVGWLVLFAALGGTWFAFNPPTPVDDGQHPVFNAWIFAADTLLPIVNLGQDGYWRLDGPSQWISTALVASGWILATTAAAGAARVLKRT